MRPIRPKEIFHLLRRYKNPAIFLAGFLFDAFTIKRIDAFTDLAIQVLYLIGLTVILIFQHKQAVANWEPKGLIARVWNFNIEGLHFLYGGLLSAYVILYFKSSSGSRTLLFFVFLTLLLVANEMPQIKRFGRRLRLGLYAFCLCSFMLYFIPVLIGRMNNWVFALSMVISGSIVLKVALILAKDDQDPKKAFLRLFYPAGLLMAIVITLYSLKLIPPVPLSVQYQGIFHDVQKTNGVYTLRYPKPPFYYFWRDDSRPFKYRRGDELVYFVRVFAPERFKHDVRIRWFRYNPKKEAYVLKEDTRLPITGGREQGFRGYRTKSVYQKGLWKVSTETADGRVIGYLKFKVIPDKEIKKRVWKTITH